MAAHYSLRMSFGLQADREQVRGELLELCRETHADEITLMIFAETFCSGHETLDELRVWLDMIRPWKKALEKEGVSVNLNPWITVLHCDRGRSLKPSQTWQPMVDWRGRAASAVVCPLDPAWRAYYREAMALYAAERFRVIWLEDDIRLANHQPLDWGGCFCPLHVAEFNRRASTSATRDEIVSALMEPGEPHPWRVLWLDMWDDTQVAMVKEFRQVVEPHGVQLGLMSSGPMVHAMEGRRWDRWWSALSGDGPSVHRPHFTGYTDSLGSSLPLAIHMLDMNRTVQPDDVEIVPEVESFPHGWGKSLRQTAAHMVLAQVFGAHRLNLSVYDYLGNPPSDNRAATQFLAGWKPTLDWLSELFPPTLRSQGIGCPWREDMTKHKHATPGASTWMGSLFCPTHGWPSWLGGFGHAFQMRIGEAVNAVGGDLAWTYSDEEIRQMLGRGLLLDGQAAVILEERGFGPWLGVNNLRVVTQNDVLYSMEELTDPRFTRRVGALVNIDDRPAAQRIAQGQPVATAEVVSVLRGPRFDRVGHGVVIFENQLGGRVAICPWDVNAPEQFSGQRTMYRASQIDGLVHYLSRGRSLGRVSGAPWLVSQFLSDGAQWRGVVWNAGPDAVTEIEVSLPDPMDAAVVGVQVDADGNRTACEFDERTLKLAQPLHQWECVVLYHDE